MADWLRPVFQRSRSTIPSAPSHDRTDDDGPDVEDNVQRRSASRVSSYLNLRSATASPAPVPEPSFLNFRKPDPNQVYEPSADAMAETLKVIMMTRSSLDPVPVEYNAIILRVLEAYHDLRQELKLKEETIDELREGHKKTIAEFEGLTSQWEEKEQDYKIDIRNLEILLSRTDGGMENVMLTRTNSAIRSRGAAGTVSSSLQRVKGDAALIVRAQGRSQNSSDETVIYYGEDQEMQRRYKHTTSQPSQRATTDPVDMASYHPDNEFKASTRHDTNDLTSAGMQKLVQTKELRPEDLERQESIKKFGVAFESSESGTSTESDNESLRSEPRRHEKPLPTTLYTTEHSLGVDRPIVPNARRPQRALQDDTPAAHLKRFSFQMGDETELFRRGSPKDPSKKRHSEADTRLPKLAGIEKKPSNSSIGTNRSSRPSKALTSRTPSDSPSRGIPKITGSNTQGELGLPRDESKNSIITAIHRGSLQRDDSQSSIVTAVRNNSGRSSTQESQRCNSNAEARRLERGKQESNEAAVAAARALSGSKKLGQMGQTGRGTQESKKEGNGGSNIGSDGGSGTGQGSGATNLIAAEKKKGSAGGLGAWKWPEVQTNQRANKG